MTREIAKRIVKGITDKIECNTADIDDWAEFWGFTREEYEEFLDMPIKALEQEPCEDCISRNTVLTLINDVKNANGFSEYSQYEYLFDQVDTMPSVTPQEPILDQISEIIEPLRHLPIGEMSDIEWDILRVIDKYKAESEVLEDGNDN